MYIKIINVCMYIYAYIYTLYICANAFINEQLGIILLLYILYFIEYMCRTAALIVKNNV